MMSVGLCMGTCAHVLALKLLQLQEVLPVVLFLFTSIATCFLPGFISRKVNSANQ